MAEYTVKKVKAGSQVVDADSILTAASTDGDSFVNNDRTFLVIKNGGGTTCNVALTAQKSAASFAGYGELPIVDIEAVVLAGDIAILAAPPAAYNNSAGQVEVTYDQTDTVTAGAFERSPE